MFIIAGIATLYLIIAGVATALMVDPLQGLLISFSQKWMVYRYGSFYTFDSFNLEKGRELPLNKQRN